MGYYNIYEEYGLKHYQLPKVFFTNEKYMKMSNDAKIAWSILRDRFSLSAKNGWYDDLGNIYFLFTNENMCDLLNLSEPTVIKIKNELIENKLLFQKRTGLNQANRLYLLKPVVSENDIYKIKEQEENTPNTNGDKELKNFKFKNSNNLSSRTKEPLVQELKSFKSNDTDLNKTDLNKTESNNHHQEEKPNKQQELINEVAKEYNLSDDDDIYIKLVSKVKEYKPNSKAYVQKIYETIINENNKPKTFAANNKEINNNAPDWFINGEHKKKKPQEKTVQPTKEEQKRLDELMKLYASENS